MTQKKRRQSSFGSVRKLPSGRYQARYTGPDGRPHTGDLTYDTKGEATAFLATVRADIVRNSWAPGRSAGEPKPITFGAYSAAWLEGRRIRGKALAARTREHYQRLLDVHILPTFGDVPLRYITSDAVDAWYAVTATGTPTTQSHAYSLLRTILGTAVDRGLIETANPAKIRGAGNVERVKKVRPASLDELEVIVAAMPARLQLMTLLASWCALRFGELAELRRHDVDTKHGVLRIRRAVVRAGGEAIVKTPKSAAGTRDVAIPPHLLPLVAAHLLEHAAPGRDGLLFPATDGGHLAPSSLYGREATKTRAGFGFYEARAQAGRTDLRWHDLRHTGAVLAAQTGATLAELMGRLGHSTPGAAMRYQHAAAERDQEIARRLSAMVVAKEE